MEYALPGLIMMNISEVQLQLYEGRLQCWKWVMCSFNEKSSRLAFERLGCIFAIIICFGSGTELARLTTLIGLF